MTLAAKAPPLEDSPDGFDAGSSKLIPSPNPPVFPSPPRKAAGAVVADKELARKARALVEERGEASAAVALGISRQCLLRIVAELPVRRGSILVVTAAFASLGAAA